MKVFSGGYVDILPGADPADAVGVAHGKGSPLIAVLSPDVFVEAGNVGNRFFNISLLQGFIHGNNPQLCQALSQPLAHLLGFEFKGLGRKSIHHVPVGPLNGIGGEECQKEKSHCEQQGK